MLNIWKKVDENGQTHLDRLIRQIRERTQKTNWELPIRIEDMVFLLKF